jgi:Activator of Hsp90 ATPase homolog 1-like protein
VTRVFLDTEIRIDCPPPKVFAVWSAPAALAQWIAPMAIVPPLVALDFRPGGRYAIRMTLPDNRVFTTTVPQLLGLGTRSLSRRILATIINRVGKRAWLGYGRSSRRSDFGSKQHAFSVRTLTRR